MIWSCPMTALDAALVEPSSVRTGRDGTFDVMDADDADGYLERFDFTASMSPRKNGSFSRDAWSFVKRPFDTCWMALLKSPTCSPCVLWLRMSNWRGVRGGMAPSRALGHSFHLYTAYPRHVCPMFAWHYSSDAFVEIVKVIRVGSSAIFHPLWVANLN